MKQIQGSWRAIVHPVRRCRRWFRSWRKEERVGPQRLWSWTVLVSAVFTPVLVVHLINRSSGLLNQRLTARDDALALLETLLAESDRNAWDWAHWTDTYQFAIGQDKDYISNNLKTAALFNNGAVMLMLRPDRSSLLSYSKPPLHPRISAVLHQCLRGNLSRLTDNRSRLRLACRDGSNTLFLGAATPITVNSLQGAPAGTLALLQPLPRRDDSPAMERHLRALQGQLLWQPAAADDQTIEPAILSAGGAQLGLQLPRRTTALKDTLQNDVALILAIPAAAVLLRSFSLLERRRQRLRERQLERLANQRLRATCRELDQLIDELLPAARNPEHSTSTSTAIPERSNGVDQTTRRFRDFLQCARELALFDSLTELPNRHYFIQELRNAATRNQQSNKHFAVFFIDIDKFKIINDSFGHVIGDAVLLDVCQRLRIQLRNEDFLARYGGDELAMILDLSQLRDQTRGALSSACRLRARQMADAMQDPVIIEDLNIPVSLSIGITLVDPDEQDLTHVIQRSDQAMYQAKRNRSNRIVGPDDVVQIPQLSSYQLFTDLLAAIRSHQLQIYFQPICNTAGNQTAVEALARWQHPERGWIEPRVFLDIAEQHRQMYQLGEELIHLSLDGFQQLQQADPDLRLFLNLAPSQLTNPRLAHSLLEAIKRRDLRAQQIVLELTENTLLEPLPQVVRNLDVLRAAGISLALDDFGTGYSSLVRLKSLSPDIIKIDKAFIQALQTDTRAVHIISLIAELAPRLGMELIAEGIEDRKTWRQLVNLGIQRFQGHELGKPCPLIDLLAPTLQQQANQDATASNRSIA